jgi:hypothetical protein
MLGAGIGYAWIDEHIMLEGAVMINHLQHYKINESTLEASDKGFFFLQPQLGISFYF